MLLNYYLEKLGYNELPEFLHKYLYDPKLLRLKKINYFCGMNYASKDIYNFKENITRYDHSLTVCLLTYRLTKSKTEAIAALYHDISTPCFSHVIDYMNKDYDKQESTEDKTEEIMRDDLYLIKCLNEDGIDIDDVINFKKFSVVDCSRPKLCADRLDGIILTGISWVDIVTKEDIDEILDNITIYINEDNEKEIGFISKETALKVYEINKAIDKECHSDYDNYMMELLAHITKLLIDECYISYDDLYVYNEPQIYQIIEVICNKKFKGKSELIIAGLMKIFKNIKKEEVPAMELNVKQRCVNPLLSTGRMK
ncbi:MAG: HD domain-containing protein [Bacilli bacterium]|nr:HD domain-containing protein [Bacilli bacterium]